MSDQDPELTPEQEARVRRLLAEARPDPQSESLPPEVAARLDQALTALVHDPATAPVPVPVPGSAGTTAPSGQVVALAARRRRHVGGLLLAAAAVAVAAVGVGQVVDLGGSDSGEDASSTAAVDSGEGADRSGGDTAGGSAESLEGDLAEEDQPDPVPEPQSGLVAPQDEATSSSRLQAVTRVRVRVTQFSRDAAQVRAALGPAPARDEYVAPAPARLPAVLRTRRVFECGSTDVGPGTWVAVVYDGSSGVLVFRRSDGETQVAELVQCSTGEILRSTTLPARPRP